MLQNKLHSRVRDLVLCLLSIQVVVENELSYQRISVQNYEFVK